MTTYKTSGQALTALIAETRRAFQDLSAYGAALHGDLGVNASMRAVLEHLDENGPASVANIARAKNVSRQHIQNIADQLIAEGLAEQRDNPEHKRSWLIAPTRRGANTFSKIKTREEAELAALAGKLSRPAMADAVKTLQALRTLIQQQKGASQ